MTGTTSVATERTREIGIRVAIGATEADIQFQVVAEAVAISFLGGLLGVIADVGAFSLFQSTLRWDIQLTLNFWSRQDCVPLG